MTPDEVDATVAEDQVEADAAPAEASDEAPRGHGGQRP